VTEVKGNRKNENGITGMIYFDLQNVIGLPRANVPSFNYERKLNFLTELKTVLLVERHDV
jgi:hypothetical protein